MEGVPTLVLFRPDGSVLTAKGRDLVSDNSSVENSLGKSCPEIWAKELNNADLHIISYACQQTSHSALKENSAGRLEVDKLNDLKQFLQQVESTAYTLPLSADVRCNRPSLPLPLGNIASTGKVPLPNFKLLSVSGMDKYAGNVSQQPTPVLANLLDVPQTVSSVAEAQAAEQLPSGKKPLQRAMDGSSSWLSFNIRWYS